MLLMAYMRTCGRAVEMHSLVAPVVLSSSSRRTSWSPTQRRNPSLGTAPSADMTDVQIVHQ